MSHIHKRSFIFTLFWLVLSWLVCPHNNQAVTLAVS
jgi:hypothetical protein